MFLFSIYTTCFPLSLNPPPLFKASQPIEERGGSLLHKALPLKVKSEFKEGLLGLKGHDQARLDALSFEVRAYYGFSWSTLPSSFAILPLSRLRQKI